MPPTPHKPPLRIPMPLPTSASRATARPAKPGRFTEPAQARPAPLPPTQTRAAPPHQPWFQTHGAQVSARYLAWTSRGVLLLCGLLWLRDQTLDYQHVRGTSMAPTLNPRAHETDEEDYVITRAWHASGGVGGGGRRHAVQRGDVVTFWKPHRPEEISIKRVVAVGGDRVYPCRGYAVDGGMRGRRLQGGMDGVPDRDEDAVLAGEGELGWVVVPYGHVWVEGDNWRNSLDSNDFGPVSTGLIIGKAEWIWRSWMQFERVGDGREKREKGKRSRVVEGKAELPARFLD